ncbi:MAG: TetR/AcrR family transcriptional regulator [Pseudomonas sp.]
MVLKETLRPGGRSARVQQAVHQAVQALLAERERDEVTVPQIAAQAGVTPSTIYRRWGDLPTLLADVAVERLRPEGEPLDTGSLRGDLLAWGEQYREEMASGPGQAMVRDVLGSGANDSPCQCYAYTMSVIQIMLDRAVARGEPAPEVRVVMDRFVAPVIYRLLFTTEPVDQAHAEALLLGCLS